MMPDAPITWTILGAPFGVDAAGRPFLLVTVVLWSVAALWGMGAMRRDPRRGTFAAAFACAGVANVGVTLAQDVVAFYTCFAAMSFASYLLVVHRGDTTARHAGRVYLGLVVVGEVLVFTGLALAAERSGTLRFAPDAAAGRWEVLCLLAGFGIKAALVPLHVWLPLAHPVAPTAASAVLSGAMLKAGLLGWIRLLPLGVVPFDPAVPIIGVAVLLLGAMAVPVAALVGLTQRRPKPMLAYSSVSQMGLMTAAIGAGLARPSVAAAAVVAATALAVHHALAKGALFLGVGTAHALPPAQRRRFGVALAVPAAAIAGVPYTSGALGKALLGGLPAAVAGGAGGIAGALVGISALTTTALMTAFVLDVVTDDSAADAAPIGLLVAVWGALAITSGLGWLFVPMVTGVSAVAGGGGAVLLPAVGAVLGWWVHARRRHGRPLMEVPAGDVLAVLARGYRRGRQAMRRRMTRDTAPPGRRTPWRGWRRRAGVWLDVVEAEAGVPAVTGAALFAVLLALVLAAGWPG